MSSTLRPLDGAPVWNLPPPPAVMAAPQHIGARRSAPRAVAGLLVTTLAVLVFVTIDLRAGHQRQVLAVTTAVAAGQPLSADDVVAVAVSAESGVPLVAASDLATVIGRTAAVPLVRGELLAPRLLGPASFPPDGQAVIGIDIKPGQAPAGLQPGSTVLVLATPAGSDSATAAPVAAPAVQASVMSVDVAADGSGDLVVSLLVARDAAVSLGGVTVGSVSLVIVGAH